MDNITVGGVTLHSPLLNAAGTMGFGSSAILGGKLAAPAAAAVDKDELGLVRQKAFCLF